MKKKIILLSGDPNSINSEIIYKSLKNLPASIKKKIYLITNFNLIKKQFKILNYSIRLVQVKDINENISGDALKVININLDFKDPFKVSLNSASKFIKKSLNLGHKFALKNNVSGLINCPINKSLLKKNKIGVTEYLASKCGVNDNSEVMLIRNERLSVSPLTTHVDIKDVSKKINRSIIIKKVETINQWFKKFLNKKPKIGILGLNPHNAEFRKNSEENKIIIPTILNLKKKGVKLNGPLVSDTIFINDHKNYDIIIGMFHDQVIAPFKSMFKFDAINITLGLKYLRASPDHGVATNLIKKKKANAKSLISCIKFMHKFGK